MGTFKFDEIAFNSTEKKKPVDEDKYTYLGLEHLDSDSIYVTRYGADVAPKGDKLIMKKGDVLGVARVAGIMGVKRTSELIPMCHPLPIQKCSVDYELDETNGIIRTFCTMTILLKLRQGAQRRQPGRPVWKWKR